MCFIVETSLTSKEMPTIVQGQGSGVETATIVYTRDGYSVLSLRSGFLVRMGKRKVDTLGSIEGAIDLVDELVERDRICEGFRMAA